MLLNTDYCQISYGKYVLRITDPHVDSVGRRIRMRRYTRIGSGYILTTLKFGKVRDDGGVSPCCSCQPLARVIFSSRGLT